MTFSQLKFGTDGLLTVVAQDRLSGELRMLAHANQAALEATLRSGEAHFFSRSRSALWRKGESSGHVLQVSEIWVDCDGDAVLYLVEPEGPSCHTGRQTCFFRQLEPSGELRDDGARHGQPLLARLWAELEARKTAVSPSGKPSYTRQLLDAGPQKIAAKVEEEAGELARALVGESPDRVVS